MTEAQGRVGRWLRNKWHLDSLIAIGGMAAVYASTHRNGARAAIKLLHSQYTRNEQARRRFMAEGYAANKVGHRNAVSVLDDDTTEDGEVYLVMELLEGESLEGRLERVGVMSPMAVLELADQLLEVLAAAHPKGILHRDIKPANIYLTRDGSVKLLDFGLARVRELSAEAMDQSDGIVFGTVSYIAPEQARADNQNLDARSDMWSIAATMFRALSGETVHPSTGPIIDRLMAVARKPPRSIASVMPRLPKPVIELVDRALAFDPEDRWPSANVMRVVVQDVMAQLREEAEAAAADEFDAQSSAVFQRNPANPGRPRTAPNLPTVRAGGTIPPSLADSQQRPKTDPVALSNRPRTLPGTIVEPAADAPSDAEVTQTRATHKRSRTLLTREGRAELRRILDARKAAMTGEGRPAEEPATNDRSEASDSEANDSGANDSGSSDIDVDVEDSLVEVTIDHTRQGPQGPIAEAIGELVTATPTIADRTMRQTGGFASLGGPRRDTSAARVPTGSVPTLGGAAGPRTASGGFPTVAPPPRLGGPHGSESGSGSPGPEDRRPGASASYPSLGGATSRPIMPDAHRPRAGGAVSGELDGGPARPSGDTTRIGHAPLSGEPPASRSGEITRIGPAPVSGEINAGQTRGPTEITRIGPAPAAPPSRVPTEVTPRPAVTGGLHDTIRPKTIPPLAPRSSQRPSGTHEPARAPGLQAPASGSAAGPTPRARPITEPSPVAGGEPAPRARPITEPSPVAGSGEPTPRKRSVTEPSPVAAPVADESLSAGEQAAAESGARAASRRAGVFTAPPTRPSGPLSTAASRAAAAAGAEPSPSAAGSSSNLTLPGGAGEAARGSASVSGTYALGSLLPQRGAAKPAGTDASQAPARPTTAVSPRPTTQAPGGAPQPSKPMQATGVSPSPAFASKQPPAASQSQTAPVVKPPAASQSQSAPVVKPTSAAPAAKSPAASTSQTAMPIATQSRSPSQSQPAAPAVKPSQSQASAPVATQSRSPSQSQSAAAPQTPGPAASPPTQSPSSSTPAGRPAKSVFNPYPALASTRTASEDTRTGPAPTDPKAKKPAAPATPAASDASDPARDLSTRTKTGASPVLPFNFLRPGPAAKTSEPPADPPKGDGPTRKKP